MTGTIRLRRAAIAERFNLRDTNAPLTPPQVSVRARRAG